jgi:methylated-DNA-protein-cysteine methyltransferase-like protein
MSSGFSSPPDPAAFNEKVYEIARQIPPGKVFSYGQIAALIPPPGGMNLKNYDAFGPRWVGGAMARCPSDVPWQRVISSQGKISLRNPEAGEEQRRLLEAEGVKFTPSGKVDMKIYRWEGPSRDWLEEHGLSVPPEEDEPLQPGLGID